VTGEEWAIDAALAAEIDVAAKTWQQGDAVADVAIVRYAYAHLPLTAATARAGTGATAIREPLDRAAIISQTCEVARPCTQRPLVHIAAVVTLHGATLDEAKRGWRPQYVAVPWAGDDQFVDLELQGAVEESVLLNAGQVASCPDSVSAMRFSSGLARHRARFAFPDDLAPTLTPLVNRLREKAGKDTPQGRRIDEVIEIRARASPNWDAERISVELVFLINPLRLPSQSLTADPPSALLAEIGGLDAQRLAELLDDVTIDSTRRNALWQRLVDSWSLRAKPTGCVEEVTGLAVPLNEFSRLDERSTPELDLDYLSS
jgi:hypothetical protein